MAQIDETIPGGRYKGADGTWHDANGKPLPAPVELVVTPDEQAIAVMAVESEPLPVAETKTKPAPKKAGK